MQQQDHGTWVKYADDGRRMERVAYSPADAVKLRFDGWERQDPLPEQPGPITRGTTAPKSPSVNRPVTPPADTKTSQ